MELMEWCKATQNFYYCRFHPVTLNVEGGVKPHKISTIVDGWVPLTEAVRGVKPYIISTIVDMRSRAFSY